MKKHKGLLSLVILCLILALLYATYMLSKTRIEQAAINLPVQKVSSDVKLSPASVSSLEDYREKREATRQEDMRTLQTLLDSSAGNADFLADVAQQLAQTVASREAEIAIEGALMGGGFSPCLAVVAPGSVTVIVSRDSLTRGEAALILTLCEKHTSELPENIKIMTNDTL